MRDLSVLSANGHPETLKWGEKNKNKTQNTELHKSASNIILSLGISVIFSGDWGLEKK